MRDGTPNRPDTSELSGTTRVKIVIGANLGDEGKGLMTDHFCAAHPGALVVLTNGGAQRGHTVEREDGARRVFRHLGSGSLRGAGSHFSGRYILNPMQFCRELAENPQASGLPLSRDAACLWSTPFDMIANQIQTLRQGRTNSCGMGIWATLERYRHFREAGRETPTLAEFVALPEAAQLDWVQDMRRYHEERLRALGMSLSDHGFARVVDAPGLLTRFLADCRTLAERAPVRQPEALGPGPGTVIYENAQGLLLDQDIADAAEVNTPSCTGLGEVFAEVESTHRGAEVEVCYVSRAYLTRHGEGKLEGECAAEDIGRSLRDRTNETNPFQGPLRYARLDKRALVQRIQADFRASVDKGPTWNRYCLSLCLTHMNECGLDYRDIGDEVDRLYVSFGRTSRDVRLVRDGNAAPNKFI